MYAGPSPHKLENVAPVRLLGDRLSSDCVFIPIGLVSSNKAMARIDRGSSNLSSADPGASWAAYARVNDMSIGYAVSVLARYGIDPAAGRSWGLAPSPQRDISTPAK